MIPLLSEAATIAAQAPRLAEYYLPMMFGVGATGGLAGDQDRHDSVAGGRGRLASAVVQGLVLVARGISG